jgi:hypothetical protein
MNLYVSNLTYFFDTNMIFQINITKHYLNNLTVVDTSNLDDGYLDHEFPFSCRPDCSVYHNTCEQKKGLNASLVDFFIEFKAKSHDDPFTTHAEGPFRRETQHEATQTAGQITAYASLLLGAQYRTHTFFILIIRDYARLFRWDRSGAVFTAPIYYDREPHLFNFLIRYNVAGEETRGHDSTVFPFKPDEGQEPLIFTKSDDAKQLLSITIQSKHFIVPSPSPRPGIPVGRWTRASIAYDLQRKKYVLKDS